VRAPLPSGPPAGRVPCCPRSRPVGRSSFAPVGHPARKIPPHRAAEDRQEESVMYYVFDGEGVLACVTHSWVIAQRVCEMASSGQWWYAPIWDLSSGETVAADDYRIRIGRDVAAREKL
jgi:hypothetical protein